MASPPELSTLMRLLLPALAPLLGFTLWLGLRGADPEPWQLSLILAWIALLGWIYSYRRYRHYADTPCAAVGSAPQGYIALEGIGRPLPGEPLRSPFNYLPCLWYRVRIEVRDSDDKWQEESDDSSESSFILEDEDGARCYIDPVGARIEVLHKDEIRQGDRRITQWLLIPGTRLHAIGHFESRRPIEDRDSIRAELRDKLADWKASGQALRQFDQDGSGELDLDEWEKVRQAAHQEVLQEREAAADFPAYHVLGAPGDGRPFVISNHPPEQVRRRFQRQAWIVLALFFLALGVTAWMATHP